MQIIDGTSSDDKGSPIIDLRRLCQACYKERTSHGWCKDCETSYMILNFARWTTGNKNLDNLIRNTQKNAAQTCDYLEYIDFNEFDSIEFIAKGGFSAVYKAEWLEGPRWNWDEVGQMWCRSGPITVALKRLDNSQNISNDFLNQVERHHRCLQSGSLADCFGITRDPTGAFMFVMRYYENGNLYQYLDKSKGIISWRDMVDMLWGVAGGLERIHAENRFHSNLHGGNLLIEDEAVSTDARIADVGLHGPADKFKPSQIYGVLPFIAPEILLGEKPSQSSDIYSFGIIMCTLATGKRPFADRSHDFNLAKEICFNNLRPDISDIFDDMPKAYYEWMVKCWDADPQKRPTASQLNELLGEWITSICDDPNPSVIADQFSHADEKRWELIGKHMNKIHSPSIHPGAYFISRPIDFFIINNFCNFHKL